jgi:hypothetical protein
LSEEEKRRRAVAGIRKGKEEEHPEGKGTEILRQMRDDAIQKKHLDQQKLRASAALQRAIEGRDEEAFISALVSLGIDPKSAAGKAHLQGFRQLPRKRY